MTLHCQAGVRSRFSDRNEERLHWGQRSSITTLLDSFRLTPTAPPGAVASNISICVSHVIPILLVESIVCDQLERLPPKDETILQAQPDALEEKCVLQPAVVLQMAIFAQRHVKITHAERKIMG